MKLPIAILCTILFIQTDCSVSGAAERAPGNLSWTAPDEYKASRADVTRGLVGIREDETRPVALRPWIGAQLKELGEPIEKFGGSPGEVGILFAAIVPDSLAAAAGLAKGDVLVALDGNNISSEGSPVNNFLNALGKHKPSDKVALTILREKKRLTIEAVLGLRKEVKMPQMPHPELTIGPTDKPTLLEAALATAGLKQQYLTVQQMMRVSSNYTWDDGKTAPGVVNPFRLRRFTWAYEHPSMASAAADRLVKEMQRHYNAKTQSPSGLIEEAARNLDVAVTKVDVPRGPTPIESLLDAFAAAGTLRRKAFARLAPDELKLLETKSNYLPPQKEKEDKTEDEDKNKEERFDIDQVCRIAYKVDYEALFGAAYVIGRELLPDRVKELVESASKMPRRPLGPEDAAQFGGDVILVSETPLGKLVIGGPGPTTYKGNAAIIIDVGGDDAYLNNAGGTTDAIRLAVVIDAAGNDTYVGGSKAQGFGQTGVGFILDLSGDDGYRAADLCQGAGIFGVGMIIDQDGDDGYRGKTMCQGAALFGIGIIADLGGNDNYYADEFAQGLGYVKGFGAIMEVAGSDVYFAGGKEPDYRAPDRSFVSFSQGVGLGHRNEEGISYPGGIGLLSDASGHDHYVADYFSQGSAYWFAMGILADDLGGDDYFCGRYSQGAGIHLAVGVLLDHAGDDHYTSYYGVSQGCGHDLAVGIIEDEAGNDKYTGGVLTIGAGNDNGIGMIIDHAGGDEYSSQAASNSVASGSFNKERNLGSFGIIIDLGGDKDVYGDPVISNDAVTLKTRWGIAIDMSK